MSKIIMLFFYLSVAYISASSSGGHNAGQRSVHADRSTHGQHRQQVCRDNTSNDRSSPELSTGSSSKHKTRRRPTMKELEDRAKEETPYGTTIDTKMMELIQERRAKSAAASKTFYRKKYNDPDYVVMRNLKRRVGRMVIRKYIPNPDPTVAANNHAKMSAVKDKDVEKTSKLACLPREHLQMAAEKVFAEQYERTKRH